AQTQVEQQNFEIRKNVLKYDEVLNKQRTVIYDERRQVLSGADLSDQIRPMITSVVTSYVEGATSSGYPEEWDLEQLWVALKTLYPISLTPDEAIKTAGGERNDLTREFLVEEIVADAQAAYDQRESELGAEVTRELERRVLLSVLDRKWREHLYEMDYLQEGIGLRAMAQRDPLVEYQKEGFDMFRAMMDAIQEESVGFLFNLEVQIDSEQPPASEEPAAPDSEPSELHAERVLAALATQPEAEAEDHPHISAKGLGRSKAEAAPLTYSAPALGSETPEVHVEGGSQPAAGNRAGAAKQRRANPNRGSRGNKRKR
ncbi:MAG: preprotein translocase subunit SecA, partial [Pseudonocardiales bacterium]|nr:preprotein translocase subunit SecA [Pseudonocardiales bacterium]